MSKSVAPEIIVCRCCAMEQFIESSIKAVGLNIDTNSLKVVFDELGIDEPSDVINLRDEDLSSVLKTIQARKLIAYFKTLNSSPTVELQQPLLATVPCEPPASVEPSVSTNSVVIARPSCSASTMSPCGRLPVPYLFPLHSVRESLRAAITNSEHLQTGQRSEIMEAIYEDVTKFTL